MKAPLVTIGIPTYNRATGLRRTLEQVTDQTYSNLEILISDNASPDPNVQDIIREFASRDRRIRPFLQNVNLGATGNFRFVLKASNGEYFMWASDDDHHCRDFVERCVGQFDLHGNTVGSVMTQAAVHNRVSGIVSPMSVPEFPCCKDLFRKLRHHLQAPVPTLIYGLHRREAIRWFEDAASYDWFDCFFVTKILLGGFDVRIITDYLGYTAGIDSEVYTPKPMKVRCHALFEYMPYVKETLREIFQSDRLKKREKAMLSSIVAEFSMRNFSHWERAKRPVRARATKIFLLPPAKILRQALSSCCF